jgi:PIN domain nuclease of toxin-antitoxin system
MAAVLLDTCAVIYVANGDAIAAGARRAIREAALDEGVLVSPISAWEIGMLAARRRVEFHPDAKRWFLDFLAQSGIRVTPLSSEAAIDAASLDDPFPGDPADRLLVSTARHLDVPIVTRDRSILAYGRSGRVKSIAC